ncbi:hypothetical protein [Ideonella livida]|uniref:Uncharacterized protein n=1 Tax=Ideonella livida TaxID=2707176 RepID=A0A7C9PJP6_9BURK|nr:hypothetical protein [Ideonella livida]NDY92770.1 hypothetical protein [Ideonella livida]
MQFLAQGAAGRAQEGGLAGAARAVNEAGVALVQRLEGFPPRLGLGTAAGRPLLRLGLRHAVVHLLDQALQRLDVDGLEGVGRVELIEPDDKRLVRHGTLAL